MGWRNPPVPWSELERRLSGRPARGGRVVAFPGDGGDSPAWSRHRPAYEAPPLEQVSGSVQYAELHCHSNFSFLDGASDPEELVQEAIRLGLQALALTDHDGLYGVVRFAEAAREHGLPTIFGSELTVGPHHLVVLARDPVGYARLARAVSTAQLAGHKGAPVLDLAQLAQVGSAGLTGRADHWVVLTGCHQGAVPHALEAEGPAAARGRLDELVELFGRQNVVVELWDHGQPLDSARNDALAALAVEAGVEVVATNNVHYHAPSRRRLATALAAVRHRRSLAEADGWLPAGASAHLRSGDEQHLRFARYPGVVEQAAELGRACAFDLSLVAPELPPFPCPAGHDEMSWLRELVARGARHRYGPRHDERVAGAWRQLDHELKVIDSLGFPGYFLVVWDIVEFCRRSNIYCQGRGSAANSAVCYALGITNADAVGLGLLFERFLSPERDGPPDIDIDIESGRREEAIQYVFERHGREHAAQVCNVITYRARSAIRDMARALGYAPGQQDAFAKSIDRWNGLGQGVGQGTAEVPAEVLELARELESAPRHLGIHSGGMVICDRPIVEVCPVEWARMPGRSVLQWDKDDCAAVGLVKFDLLGLGMLEMIHGAIDLVRTHHGDDIDMATLPQEPEVYDMLCRADTIGVFQVESRAQMATLPRLRPRSFYDLVVEVALIRPGPIQGGSVHPYIRRRNGQEAVTYLHPLLEKALSKTLGIPLFQEQLMQMAIDVAGFTPSEADQLRQAMGAKRSRARMERLRERLFAGMAERGIVGEVADTIWDKLAAFANYGFPESHSVSFAYLVYASAWLKYHYPAAFCAALLNAQPMGFYHPHTIVADARRHGVEVRSPCLAASGALSTLERGEGGVAVRLGLGEVRHLGDELAEQIEAQHIAGGPYESVEDLVRRVGPPQHVLEALATAGAFDCFGLDRRQALWQAGALSRASGDRLDGIVTGVTAPQLPPMSHRQQAEADLWATGIAIDGHPTLFDRDRLTELGVVTAVGLRDHPADTRVLVGGVVTHRQRPATAGGTTFVNLEDETGLINVVVSSGCWTRYRQVVRSMPALLIRGRLERSEGVINVIAERIDPLPVGDAIPSSRDFR